MSTPPVRRFLGYDWFKLAVAVILLLLLLIFMLRGCGAQPTTAVPSATAVAAVTAAALPAPVITGPADGQTVAPDSPLTLAGTGAPGSNVEVLRGATLLGTATVGTDGTWSFEVTPQRGTNTFAVRLAGANTAAGSITLNGDPAAAASATADTTATAAASAVAEAPLAITQPADGQAVAAGATFALAGTGTPGSKIEIVQNDTVLGTATVGADGKWSFDVTPQGGPTSYAVRPAGSTAAATSITVNAEGGTADTTATAAATAAAETTATAAAPAASNGQPAVTNPQDGATVQPGPQTISGTGPAGSKLEVVNGDQVLATVDVTADGTWQANVDLAQGTAALGVRPVGGDSTATNPIRVTVGDAALATCQTLAVNCDAWVQRQGGLALRMRAGPGTDKDIVTRLPIGTQMKVLEGPQDATNIQWWRVRTTGGQEGWVAGDQIRLQPD